MYRYSSDYDYWIYAGYECCERISYVHFFSLHAQTIQSKYPCSTTTTLSTNEKTQQSLMISTLKACVSNICELFYQYDCTYLIFAFNTNF